MDAFLQWANGIVWGIPGLVLILGVGVYLTFCTGFAQITLFPRAIRHFCRILCGGEDRNGVSPFQALCTALGATVGTGNLVGVAGAICLGGPGSIFWMWVCGVVGMASKYAEVTLALRYRTCSDGGYIGGPMVTISRGMGKKWQWLGKTYCVLGILASFGVGNCTQINAVVTGIHGVMGGSWKELDLLLGLALGLLVYRLLLGGARGIGAAAERLVPWVSGAYILLCLWVLLLRGQAIPGALKAIVLGAFRPEAVTGGMLGSAFQALRVGCARGIFTNEAGMGTASIAHAAARTVHPAQQGLMGIMEVFLDTLVICTLTALVILCSGVPIPYGTDASGTLTARAFSTLCGDWVNLFLTGTLCCLAFATVLGWGLYGARCTAFLFGEGSLRWYALAQAAMVIPGAVMAGSRLWSWAELMNGLMAVPNLISLAVLSPELAALTRGFRGEKGE